MDEPQEKNRPTLIKMIELRDVEIGRVLQAFDEQKLTITSVPLKGTKGISADAADAREDC